MSSVNAVLFEREYSIHDPCRELARDFRAATKRGRRAYHRRHECTTECDCADALRDQLVDRSIVDHDTDRGVPCYESSAKGDSK